MVRTRSFGVKAGGKSAKKLATAAPASSSGQASGSKKGESGNTVQVQPTPAWQREITDFIANPAKKPRLEDSSNISVDEAVKPVKDEEHIDGEVKDNSANGSGSPKDNDPTADNKNMSEIEEKDTPVASQVSNGSGSLGSANGREIVAKDGEMIEEDVAVHKDAVEEDANGLNLPDDAEDGKKVE